MHPEHPNPKTAINNKQPGQLNPHFVIEQRPTSHANPQNLAIKSAEHTNRTIENPKNPNNPPIAIETASIPCFEVPYLTNSKAAQSQWISINIEGLFP